MDHRTILLTDVQAYAAFSARLAEPDANRTDLLAERDLDEDAWDEIDDQWQARLSEAMEAMGEEDSVPLIVKEHADAFARAQAERVRTGPPLSMERFVEITHDIQRGRDVEHAMKRNGTTLHDYLRAEKYWLGRMLDEPDLAARFQQLMKRTATPR